MESLPRRLPGEAFEAASGVRPTGSANGSEGVGVSSTAAGSGGTGGNGAAADETVPSTQLGRSDAAHSRFAGGAEVGLAAVLIVGDCTGVAAPAVVLGAFGFAVAATAGALGTGAVAGVLDTASLAAWALAATTGIAAMTDGGGCCAGVAPSCASIRSNAS